MIGLNKDLVTVVPYDKTWPEEYEKEKKILNKILDGKKYRIEHVGSTAIPNLSAKPIIDIAIGASFKEDVFDIAKTLEESGYDILDSFDKKGEVLARKGSPENRTHYIHIQIIGSEYWNEFMYFKRYLLDNPDAVKEYENLKCNLSEKYKDERKKYTAEKNEFISSILEKAYKIYKL